MDQKHAEPNVAQEVSSVAAPSLKRRLLSGSAWASGGRILTAFTAVAINALLARLLAPQDLGVYFLAFSAVQVAALLGALGLDQAVVRFVAESVGLHRYARARRALGKALVMGVLGALGVGGAYLFFGPVVAHSLFDAPALAAVTPLVAIWIVGLTLQTLLAGAFRGLHDIFLSTVFGSMLTNFVFAGSLGLLWLLRDQASLGTTLLLTLGSFLANAFLAGWFLYRRTKRLPSSDAQSYTLGSGEIMRVAWPLLVTGLTVFALTQCDLWIVGAFRSEEEVAVYGAAARALALVTMPLWVLGSVLPPLVAEMYAQGRRRELERTLRASATLAGLPAFVTIAAFLLFGGPILGLMFGDYYRQGATILALLSIAQLFNVWAGASIITLSYTGHQAATMVVTTIGGAITIVAGLVVVGPYGPTGVAATVAVGVAALEVALLLMAKRKTGMWTHAGFDGFAEAIRAARRIGR
jgi:O-antigen/teichoic acid export membrane protein